MQFWWRSALCVQVFIGIGLVSSLGSKIYAFAPKLEFHLNEEKAKEDYERACREAEEGRRYEREQQERREREERDRQQKEARAKEEQSRAEERARDQRERNAELFPR